MVNRGLVYVVHARRRDGQWISYRTCDEKEALQVAARLGVQVTAEARVPRQGKRP
jgi:hypothetical protein